MNCRPLRRNPTIPRSRSEGQKEAGFDVGAVTDGRRGAFGPQGPLEAASMELLSQSGAGDAASVARLLLSSGVHPDVSDRVGHTALIGAAVNWRRDVINVLLDAGANVNKLNDEGLSALTACFVFYYTRDFFKPNLADDPNDLFQWEELPEPADAPPDKNAAAGNAASSSKAAPAELQGSATNLSTTGGANINSVHSSKSNIGDAAAAGASGAAPSTADSLAAGKPQTAPHLVDVVAHAMSNNDYAAASLRSATDAATPPTLENTIRYLAVTKTERRLMEATLRLLLQRGADPNASIVPLPPLLTAIKATDVEMVKLLLQKGANPNIGMRDGSLFCLHLAAGISGLVLS